ncbi:MAG TPA: hypothetical protein VGD58_29780 [Herpetosiphonaceae bacterium]
MLHRLTIRQLLAHGIAMALVFAAIVSLRGQQVQAQPTWDSGLLVNTRASLRACMVTSAATSTHANAIAQRVARNFEQVRRHKDWERAGLGKAIPAIETGCAGAKAPTQALEKGALVGPGVTKNPTPFRTVIMVLDDAAADTVLGKGTSAGLFPYELMAVEEHEFVEVTSGLVVRESFLSSADFADPYLSLALGLQPSKSFERPAGVESVK